MSYVVDAGSIKYFADSIMDPDPMYRDEQYARATRHGGIIAPPTFFGSATGLRDIPAGDARSMFSVSVPLPDGWIGIASGDEYEFFAPVRAGMVLTSVERLVDAYQKDGRSGPLLFYTVEKAFTDAEGTLILRRRILCVAKEPRFPPQESVPSAAEETRVSGPDALGELTAGPLTVRYLAMFATATAEFVDIHYDADYARSVGLKAPIVQGLYKTVLIGQMLKNWSGDGTALKRLNVQHREIDFAGGSLTATGKLVRQKRSSHGHEVECSVWTFNQDGRITTKGQAWLEMSDSVAAN
ncbi:MAG: MaoC family dehydratase N-terminal domain-containing protein [Dehalococcoidia bacterium]|nr:MaoC family dehydratase N-terminal domain-containing protein [Dehalococcoidia bacterium]